MAHRGRLVSLVRQRIIYSVVALFGVLTGIFFLARLTGSPAYLYLPVDATPAMVDNFNHLNGYDQPVLVQYGHFIRDALRFNLGDSLYQHRPAVEAVLAVYPETLLVAVLTMVVALAIGLLLGWLAAVYRYTLADRAIVSAALLMASTPQFWIALVGILVFATKLGWLPTSGLAGPESFVLPVFTLCLSPIGVMTQVIRGGVIDALGSSYVMRSRALGLGTFVIAVRHVLRNVSIPITTIAGDQFAGILNGVVIVSSVFALPGLGSILYNAVLNRDYNLLQAAVLVTAVAVLLLNLAIDLLYTVLDPRVRLS